MRAVVLQSPEDSLKDLSLIQLAIPAPDVGQVLLRGFCRKVNSPCNPLINQHFSLIGGVLSPFQLLYAAIRLICSAIDSTLPLISLTTL